jgi:hypothetical protein
MTAGAHYKLAKALIDKEQSKELDRQRAVDDLHYFYFIMLSIAQLIVVLWLGVITAIVLK